MLPAPPHPLFRAPKPRLGRVWLLKDRNGPMLWVPGRGHLLALRPRAGQPYWQAFSLPPGVREVYAPVPLGRRLLLAVHREDEGPLPVLDPASGTWSAWSHEARAGVWSEPLVARSGVWVLDGRARLWRFHPEGRVLAVRTLVARVHAGFRDHIADQPRLLASVPGGVVARLPWGLVAFDEEAHPRWALHAPLPYTGPLPQDLPWQPLLEGTEAKRLMPPLYAHGWIWAPLGSTLYRIDPQSGQARAVLHAPRSGTWGAFLAELYPTATGLLVIYADYHEDQPGYTLALLDPEGCTRWRFPVVGWRPYFPPAVMGPWVLFLDRKEKVLLVLEEATGREVCRTPLPGIPDSPLALGETAVYLLLHTPEGLRLAGLEAELRPEDIGEAAWVLLHEQHDVWNAALSWLLQRRPVPAALALEEAGEARTARDLVRYLPDELAKPTLPVLRALRQKAWKRAWNLALQAEDAEALAEILLRWLAHRPEEALHALVEALEHLPVEEAWRARVETYVRRILPREKLPLWEAERSRFWLMPHVVVTMEPVNEILPARIDKPSWWRLRMKNLGYGPARKLKIHLQAENGEVHPAQVKGPENLDVGQEEVVEQEVSIRACRPIGRLKIRLEVMGQDRWGRPLKHAPLEKVLEPPRESHTECSPFIVNFNISFNVNINPTINITGVKLFENFEP